MSAVEMRLEGKDWFTEQEAASYCGVALSTFRGGCREQGIAAKRFLGRKLYSRADLYQAIASSPEWQPSTNAAKPGTSTGQKVARNSDDLSERLRPVRRREFVARRKQS